ncbi:MAG: hypothetical protein KGP06_05185 [Acidobacteria bacterium]|nr:hypothetical protein [Acidobacteriota bacterium]
MFDKKSFSKITGFAIVALLISIPQSANADKGYRYWGYFQAAAGATTWSAAMTGPTTILKDGDVEGWTFTASSNDIPATEPMAPPNFADLCGGTSEVSGKIRVGIVVDFGTAEIAPTGENPNEVITDCAVVPAKSNGLAVLQSVAKVRADKSGLICGIGGYPATECGVEIDIPVAEPLIATNTDDEVGKTASESNERDLDGAFDKSEILAIGLAIALAISIFIIIRKRKK